jgi:hypothetical protein
MAYTYQTTAWSQWTEEHYTSTGALTCSDYDGTDCSGTTSGIVWYEWVGEAIEPIREVEITRDVVWAEWSGGTITDAEDTSYEYECQEVVWEYWMNGIEDSKAYAYIPSSKVVPFPQKSTEQLRAERVQREINRIWRDYLIEEKEREDRLAEITAQELLLELIGDEQLSMYKKTGRLIVQGRKHDYIIRKDGGVFRIEKDKVFDLCIHLRDQYKYPRTDNVIALKLAIEVEEKNFNKTANASCIHDKKRQDKVREMLRVA